MTWFLRFINPWQWVQQLPLDLQEPRSSRTCMFQQWPVSSLTTPCVGGVARRVAIVCMASLSGVGLALKSCSLRVAFTSVISLLSSYFVFGSLVSNDALWAPAFIVYPLFFLNRLYQGLRSSDFFPRFFLSLTWKGRFGLLYGRKSETLRRKRWMQVVFIEFN